MISKLPNESYWYITPNRHRPCQISTSKTKEWATQNREQKEYLQKVFICIECNLLLHV